MNSKAQIGIIVLGVTLVGLFLYLNFNVNRLLFKAVPSSAVVLMEINDIEKAHKKVSKTNYWLDIQNVDLVYKLERTYALLDSIFLTKSLTNKKKLVASLHRTKSQDFDYLLFMKRTVLGTRLARVMKGVKEMGWKTDKHRHRGVDIYEVFIEGYHQPFTIAEDGKLLICSFNPDLVEDAIAEFDRYSSNGFYWKTKKPHQFSEASIYINYQQLPTLTSIFFQKDTYASPLFQELKSLLQWSQFDIAFEQKQIDIKGWSCLKRKQDNFLEILKQKAYTGELVIPNLLPFNTAGLVHFNTATTEKMFKRKKEAEVIKYKTQVLPWLGNEWAYGFCEPTSESFEKESFAVIGTKGKDIATPFWKRMINSGGVNPASIPYRDFTIQFANIEKIVPFLFGENIGQKLDNVYYTFIDNYIIVAPQLPQLKAIIEKYIAGQTLANEEDFLFFASNRSGRSNIFCYLNPTLIKKLLKSNAASNFNKNLDKKFKYYQRICPITFQFDKPSENIVTKGLIGYNKKPKPLLSLVWNSRLDDMPIGQPQIVHNHDTKEKEIIVQDKKNNLYLLSKAGKIIWKKNLPKPILGKVQQMDYFGNGVLHYIFNTQSKVYLVNRKGEDAHNYPLRLSSAATAGLLLADFEQQDGQCFIIPCGNNKVYGYEYSGKPLKGWNPRNYLGLVKFPLQSFIDKDYRYIVAANENGNIYLLNQEGELLHKVSLGSKLVAPPQIDRRAGEVKILATTKSNKTFVINTVGKYWQQKCVHMSYTSEFLTANVFGSEGEENIYMSNNKVYVYNYTKHLFDYTFPPESPPFHIFEVNTGQEGKKQIGVFSKKDSKVYLLDNYGKFHMDFPIDATTKFIVSDLFDIGGHILIAGGLDNNIFAYKLN